MHTIKLVLEYDGSRYQGWQRLGKGESSNTIANKVTEVLHKMTCEEIELFCGARTEVGVHAYGQTVHFKTSNDMKPYEICHYLNRFLPMDIAVLSAEEMPERFHASLNAKSRTYLYRVTLGEVPSVFERKYTYYAFKAPEIAVMQQAAIHLAGTHDFLNFSTVKKNKSTEKTIQNLTISGNEKEIQIRLKANDFLHNMPRMLVGTLLDIGLGKRKADCIDAIFAGTEEASVPCEPKGLFLESVEY